MRFFHISDLHIGKQLHTYSLKEEQEAVLSEIVERLKEYKPRVLIMAGDIYDKSAPSGEAFELFNDFLNKIDEVNDFGCNVLIIAGNHDSVARLNFAASFLEKHNIYISTFPPVSEGEHLKNVTLEDEYGDVTFRLFPFMKPGYVRALLGGDETLTYDGAFRKILEREDIDYSKRNVLIAHQFFKAGSKSPECCDSESVNVNVGGLDAIDVSAVSAFDYVALGHIHGAQNIGGGNVRYCGTPLKYSVSEAGHKKSVTMVTLNEKEREPDITEIPLSSVRDVVRLKGKLEEVRAQRDFHRDDYVSIVLTDEETLSRPKDILMEDFNRILEVSIDNERTRHLISGEDYDSERELTPFEAFSEFYAKMQGAAMSEEEERIMKDIIDSACEEAEK